MKRQDKRYVSRTEILHTLSGYYAPRYNYGGKLFRQILFFCFTPTVISHTLNSFHFRV